MEPSKIYDKLTEIEDTIWNAVEEKSWELVELAKDKIERLKEEL
jgi:hypothetical protein